MLHGTGETQQEVKDTMQQLAKSGIGGILDYAAEEDVEKGRMPLQASP